MFYSSYNTSNKFYLSTSIITSLEIFSSKSENELFKIKKIKIYSE